MSARFVVAVRLVLIIAGLRMLAACGVDTEPPAGGDAAEPDDRDASDRDGGRRMDAGKDGGKGGKDGGTDAGKDGGSDAGKDAGRDSGPVDSGHDAGDPCANVSCGPNETCDGSTGSAVCNCDSGYQDNDGNGSCKPACGSGSCPAHSVCDDDSGEVVCSCEDGYQDEDDNATCEPACGAGSCPANSTCADGTGSVVCTCVSGYQDHDGNGSCEPACSSTSCPLHATCADGSGSAVCTCTLGYSGVECTDTDACAVADDADGNPCNEQDVAATCDDEPAPSVEYGCDCSDGFTPQGGGCADIDECATDNGGCGDPDFYSCTNDLGAPPDCADIDECATDNGGCGDGQFYLCTNEDGAPPDCADIDECATDNGGCGHPLRGQCVNNDGAPPTCNCAAEYGGPGCAFHQVYGLDLPIGVPAWTDVGQVPYDVDNTALIAPFDRVAYRLQLDAQWVWVEFDTFTDEPRSLGIPVDEVWDRPIEHVNVRTNGTAVPEATDASGGNMELWSHCYDAGADGIFDGDDELLAIDCFGSLQFFLDGETLLAVNHWASNDGGSVDVGIGSGPIGSGGAVLDWTYANNAGSYGVRRLEVYVRELAACTASSCRGHGSCDDSTGLVACTCDAGYAGAHCQSCTADHQDNDSNDTCEPRCAPGDCTTPGEYCFDDSGTIECLDVEGSDCASILALDPAAPDDTYVVDLDGPGGNDPRYVYCDMSHGAFTLLAVAEARSRAFGNNSPVWSQNAPFGSSSIGLAGLDYKNQAYGELATDVIRLCYRDLDSCHDFAHGQGRSLQSFFVDGVSYDEYAFNIYGHANVGTGAARTQYLADIGAAEAGAMCGYWLGINERSMHSAIGLMGDANDGCGAGANNRWIDDLAIGVGLQSCADANSCPPLGSNHTAGRQQGWTGQPGDQGPWLIFGR